MRGSPENSVLPLDHLALRGDDEADALVLREGVLSYRELRSRVSRLAAWLAHEVPGKGARVASWAARALLTPQEGAARWVHPDADDRKRAAVGGVVRRKCFRTLS